MQINARQLAIRILTATCTFVALTACAAPTTMTQTPASGARPPSLTAPPASPAVGSGGNVGAARPSGSPAAEHYAACLREHGVDAIASGNEVLKAATPGAGTIQVGSTAAPGDPVPSLGAAPTQPRSQAEDACHKAVPEYVEPDLNQK